MPTYKDPFILNTNLNWNGSSQIVSQLRGKSFGVNGRTKGDYIAEITYADVRETSSNPNDPLVDDADGPNGRDKITVGAGKTLPSKTGLLDWTVGILQYEIELTDGTVLTQKNFPGNQLPIRILDSSADLLVYIDLGDLHLATLNTKAPIAKISFPADATQQSNYSGYKAAEYDAVYTPVCFTTGTLIKTDRGAVPIECLRVGDSVLTLDNGYQNLRWIFSTTINQSELIQNQKLLPIRIAAGALKQDIPDQDLIVSRQHRILIRSKIAERMFNNIEILVPAIQCVEYEGIEIATDIETVTYWHLLFDKHEIIFANGAPTESLFTGSEAIKSVSPEAREEIVTLFPHITVPDFAPESARLIPEKGSTVKKMIVRHMKHNMELL